MVGSSSTTSSRASRRPAGIATSLADDSMAPRSPLNLAIQSPQAEKTLSARAREVFVICDFSVTFRRVLANRARHSATGCA
jgi:hypothetical protein